MADNNATEVVENHSQITIDYKTAEDAAKLYDYPGRDLEVHLDLDFGFTTPMNFVTLDPVLFNTSSFIEVIDLATAEENQDFVTVEGFNEQSFDKILTPEANKVVSDDVVSKTLAPSKFAYQGLGVFTFPLRIGNRLRVTLRVKEPSPVFYERMHVLTQENIKTKVVTKSSKKGL